MSFFGAYLKAISKNAHGWVWLLPYFYLVVLTYSGFQRKSSVIGNLGFNGSGLTSITPGVCP
jgi:hypothetical protein